MRPQRVGAAEIEVVLESSNHSRGAAFPTQRVSETGSSKINIHFVISGTTSCAGVQYGAAGVSLKVGPRFGGHPCAPGVVVRHYGVHQQLRIRSRPCPWWRWCRRSCRDLADWREGRGNVLVFGIAGLGEDLVGEQVSGAVDDFVERVAEVELRWIVRGGLERFWKIEVDTLGG